VAGVLAGGLGEPRVNGDRTDLFSTTSAPAKVIMVVLMVVKGHTEVVVVVVVATDKEVVNTTNTTMQNPCQQNHPLLLMWEISHSIVCKETLMTSLVSLRCEV